MNKNIYLLLAVIGLVLPYSQFIPFVAENGLDVGLVITEIASSRITAFGWLDVIVTAVTVLVMVFEKKTKNWWIPVVATLLIGPSCGLPLLMYLRNDYPLME